MTTNDPSALDAPLARADVLRALSVAALAGIPLVLAIGRAPAPRWASLGALLVLAPTLHALRALDRSGRERPALRTALLLLASACVAPLGWLFGPNAGVMAAVALLALLAGLSARRESARPSALVLAVISGGQALVTVLVLLRVLPDLSLSPVIVAGHPDWQHLAAHASAQLVVAGAFFAGRSLRDRYADVHARLHRASHAIALQRALLEEARADYRRALRTARGAGAGGVVVERSVTAEAAGHEPSRVERELLATPARGAPSPLDSPVASVDGSTASTTLFMDAHRGRMEVQHGAVLGLSTMGIAILAVIGRNALPTVVGLVCMALIAVLSLLQREVSRRRGGDESFYAPYALIGALSAGPAFAFGLHSAFATVIAALLFYGGAFRAQASTDRLGRRLPVYLAVGITHALVFTLVWSGVIPDAGNQPILTAGHAPLEPVVLHLLLQATYAAAFAGGFLLDTRFQSALREAAHVEASLRAGTEVLARTDAETAAVLEETGGGLFSGQRVGRYRVGRLLASGGLGDVYAASRDGDEAPVALKLVRWDRAAEPVALELLAREAAALARVQSPCVARIFEAGVASELPFVAMERIDGASLAEVLRTERRLDLEAARTLAEDLFRGLRDVHDAGVIHRDIKPHNVMRARDAEGRTRWKLVDFGLALHGLPSGASTVGGTAAYVAPEQALGERVDPRADLYSACLVLYRVLTGRPAFVGQDPREVAARARQHGPPDPGALVRMPDALALVLRLGLAADPKERFTTAREAAKAFAAAFDGEISDVHRMRAEALLARAPWS